MNRLRRTRRWLPAWLGALLLAAQFATAAYACPQLAAADSAPAAMADMPDCDAARSSAAMDPDQPQLCKAHCETGEQSLNGNVGAASVPAPALVDAWWARELVVLDLAPRLPRQATVRSPGPPPGTLPLYLSLLVLRN